MYTVWKILNKTKESKSNSGYTTLFYGKTKSWLTKEHGQPYAEAHMSDIHVKQGHSSNSQSMYETVSQWLFINVSYVIN